MKFQNIRLANNGIQGETGKESTMKMSEEKRSEVEMRYEERE